MERKTCFEKRVAGEALRAWNNGDEHPLERLTPMVCDAALLTVKRQGL